MFPAGQVRQVLLNIGGEFGYRDHAIMVGIDVVSGARQGVEQDLGERTVLPFLILA